MSTQQRVPRKVLAPSDLNPADVLLATGEGAVSRLIMRCDGGSYSHAALWSGEHVIEATGNGICETELYQDFDVYRAPGLSAETAAQVVTAARSSVGQRYAYTELLLLGLLLAVGLRPSRPVLAEAAARLGAKAKFLQRWVDKIRSSTVEPRVCSELVAASYAKANARLTILARSARPRIAGVAGGSGLLEATATSHPEELAPPEEFRELSRACAEILGVKGRTEDTTGYEGLRTLLGGDIGVNSQGQALGLVTPADLQFSTSLRLVGRVSGSTAPTEKAKPRPLRSASAPVTIPGLVDRLEAAIGAANYDVAGTTTDAMIAAIDGGMAVTTSDARRALKLLRRKKMFAAMRRFAEAFLRTGQDDAQVRRQIAQALIEQGELEMAHVHLDHAQNPDLDESYEIIGVRGRALKQEYFDRAPKGPQAKALLQKAVDTYLKGYSEKPEKNTWHGINAASLLRRAQKDGIALQVEETAADIARALLTYVQKQETPDAWLLATAAEADLVLDRPGEALAWARRYVQHQDADTFELSSTTRQLKQVLGLSEEGDGKELIELLNAENLKRSGGSDIPRAFRQPDGGLAHAVPVVLEVNDPQWVPPPDLEVLTRMGTIITARATQASIQAMLADPAVVALEDSGPPIVGESIELAGGAEPFATPVKHEYASDGAIVAIIDSGVDVRHRAFRNATGKTRILAYWDQGDPTGPEPWPGAGGTVHRQADIEQYLEGERPFPPSLVRNDRCHGTHVASIAAGSAFGSFPGGVAPEAPLVIVASTREFAENDPRSLGYSIPHMHAVTFIDNVARECGRPVVVNVSQGQNAGAHDGTALLEKRFERFSDHGDAPGRVIVKSAGNERDTRGHAKFTLRAQNQVTQLRWTPPFASAGPHIIELWFNSSTELAVSLEFAQEASQEVSPTNDKCSGSFQSGDVYELKYARFLRDNGASRVRVIIESGTDDRISYGEWRLRIRAGARVSQEPIHAWVERTGDENPTFSNHLDEAFTLSIPGTAENVITVGAAELLPDRAFQVGVFSSQGPTRRGAQKPDIVANGVGVIAARGGSEDGLRSSDGTSMAAPAVAGAIALVLTARPDLNAAQIRGMLCNAAGDNWDPGSGFGLLDIPKFLEIALGTRAGNGGGA